MEYFDSDHNFQHKKLKHNKNKNKKFLDDKMDHKQKIRYKKNKQSQFDDEWMEEWKDKYK